MLENSLDWRPTISLNNLSRRAKLLADIRVFFAERGVLEVETPLLSVATITDPHLQSFSVQCQLPSSHQLIPFYLQTSPEFAMKRLLAAGYGSIYQICKAFRNDEAGRLHNPEFTLLEWYRLDFDHHALMDEMDALLQSVLNVQPAQRLTYANAFEHYLGIDPHTASAAELQKCAEQQGLNSLALKITDCDTWLHLLISHYIEPNLGRQGPTFLYDFPASQAALARISRGTPSVAERFEVYIDGIELANGFHELADAHEQACRFASELKQRRCMGLTEVPIDQRLLAALAHGLPNCAGVALGIDRLLMVLAQADNIDQVICFPVRNA